MSKLALGLGLGFVAIVVVVLGMCSSLLFGYWDFTNQANRAENGIKAKYTDNQNVYDNGTKKVMEIADVPQMYADKVKEVATAAIQGRYGDKGSQAVFQTLQEVNPNVDKEMFVKIQQTIEEFRDEFKQNQRELTSQWQAYNNFLTGTRTGTFYNTIAGFAGGKFPRIDPNKYTIVTSGRTSNAFETKQDERIQLYQKPAAPVTPTPASTEAPKGTKGTTTRKLPNGVNVFVPAGGQLPPTPPPSR